MYCWSKNTKQLKLQMKPKTINFEKVVVITLDYDQYEITCNCIDSVLAAQNPCIDLLVIDNGSKGNDGMQFQRKYSGRIKIIRLENNIGYVKGVNFALSESIKLGYSYYLIMNNDTKIDCRAIEALVKASKSHQDKCIVSGKIYHFDRPEYLQYIGQYCRNEEKLDFPPLCKEWFGKRRRAI